MADYDLSIHTNPDARAWAKFFMETMAKSAKPKEYVDEEMMIAWFSNAMMAMHDHMRPDPEKSKPIAPADPKTRTFWPGDGLKTPEDSPLTEKPGAAGPEETIIPLLSCDE